MKLDYQKLRLDGIYQQDQDGNLMLRIKAPAGVLSHIQAEAVCNIAERLTNGMLHLTTRCSIELHGLRHEQLPEAFRRLAAVGLTSRGACGGAVRGISCSTTFSAGFAVCQMLARGINRHFAGNPHFEGLPKKFKVGVDGGYEASRHLIQDVGLVHVGEVNGRNLFDVWCAGGLGRAPQAGFLLENAVPEERIIPLIEAIIRVYRDNTPPPKRLKYLLNQMGKEKFLTLLGIELNRLPQPQQQITMDGPLAMEQGEILEAHIFAGEIESGQFRRLARLAAEEAGGFLALTADQNVALLLDKRADSERVKHSLAEIGLAGDDPERQVVFRVCPGSHECKMGFSPTRDVARSILSILGEKGRSLSFAISGCPNSCSQPQLAKVGIITSKLIRTADGEREPRFTLCRRSGEGLGTTEKEELGLDELLQTIAELG